jgi:hypothetical protein
LRDTYATRRPGARAAHILVISDDGVSTMFDTDEHGGSGWEIAAMALSQAAGGGTLVLNLFAEWEKQEGPYGVIRRARDEQGWHVHRVASLDELVEFARQFSRLRYGAESEPATKIKEQDK